MDRLVTTSGKLNRRHPDLLFFLGKQASKAKQATMAAADIEIEVPEGKMLLTLPKGMTIYIKDAKGDLVDVTDQVFLFGPSEPQLCGAMAKTTGKPCRYDTRFNRCPHHDQSIKLCGRPTKDGSACGRPAGPNGEPCWSHKTPAAPVAAAAPAPAAEPVKPAKPHARSRLVLVPRT